MSSSVTLTTHITAKVESRPPKSEKMVSVKLSFKRGVYQLFLLTLIFGHMGRLRQIGFIQNPYKILTLTD